ncbi:FHA domain-containing protein [Archangium primigenium]|uniref:FHA domain-containing protein n=1 Tax=[Archangium] primigenium TaxID=2792470 RepID=UPI0019576A21|nr:FHA domain-containing protein [Archangium primigenium]MBM7114753.1 FHA domain-containing protein [Archangium primigenium]
MPPPSRPPSRRPSSDAQGHESQDNTRIRSALRAPTAEEEEPRYPEAGEGGDEDFDESELQDDNSESTRAGPPLTMEIIEGPNQGRRKRFQGVRMVIGRGQDCDFMLEDQSVSRRHVELVYGGASGVMLRDLVSGNGTRVNDERVEDVLLKHGDVIHIGRTKLRFIDELERIKLKRQAVEEAERKQKEEDAQAERDAQEAAEAARKAEEEAVAKAAAEAAAAEAAGAQDPSTVKMGTPVPGTDGQTQVRALRDIPRRAAGKNDPMRLMVAGVLVVVLALIGLGTLFIKRGPPPPPPQSAKKLRAQNLLQEARAAFRAGDYAEAVDLATQADTLFPGVSTDGFLQAARAELAVVEAFARIRTLLNQGQFDDAARLLDATPHGTAQSTEETRAKLETEIAEARLTHAIRQVEAALEARDPKTARALIAQLPVDQQVTYLGRVAELEDQLAQEATDSATRDRNQRAAAARRAQEQRAAFIVAAFGTVQQRFESGDYSRAALECDRVIENNAADKEIRDRARELKKLIPEFSRYYQDAQRKLAANSLEAAARPLRTASDLYRRIGFVGSLAETMNTQLARTSVVAGKAALGRNELEGAAGFFKEALRLNPGDSAAQAGLDGVQDRLETAFRQAYMQRDRDPERSLETFRMISRLAPEGSDVKSRADAQLQEVVP